jgi:LysR family transcriptional regulator, regulator of abg operon
MKLSHIRDILAVAESGSLRSASRKLGITQPTMTRSIRDIEHEFGVVLFTRHANGVTPTDVGRLFIRRALAIQSEVRRISEDLDQAKGNFTGQVSIATMFSTSLALMPSVLPTFQKRYPHARLRITESLYHPIEADIFSGEIDFFVGPLYEKPLNTLLVAEKLFDNRRVIVARKGHPLLSATSLAELQSAQWIRGSLSERPDESDVETLFARAGLAAPEIVLQTRSAMMTLLAIIRTDLLAVMPLQCLDFAATADCIDQVKLETTLPGAPICVVRRSDLPLTPLAEGFWDMIHKAGANYDRRMRGER